MSDASLKPDPVGALAEEFVERYRRGERPSITDYCRRHAELAPRIRELFPALVMIEQCGPVAEDPKDSLLFSADGQPYAAPVRIGGYRIVREIGRGGMGIVYEAFQESLSRRVALKVLPPLAAAGETSLVRFRGEARAAARLHHTNIVPVFEVGEDQGCSFIAMQFIDGRGLDSVLVELQRTPSAAGPSNDRRASALKHPIPRGTHDAAAGGEAGPNAGSEAPASPAAAGHDADERHGTSRPPKERPAHAANHSDSSPRRYFREVAHMGVQIAEALDYAHRRGVIHRDIKPSNLLLDTTGVVWITDFGLAKTEGDAHTRTGDIVGTVRYMAPERFAGRSDPRSDVYGLGATVYELLTLRPAFDSPDRAQLMQQVLRGDPPRPRKIDPRIPRDLETIVTKAIERDPGMRFASAGLMAEDLRRFLADQPIQARRSSVWERTWRWCLRNPAVASLTALSILVFLAGLGGVSWKWREAEQARKDERLARNAADASADEVRQGMVRLKEANALLDLGRVSIAAQRLDDADAAYAKALELRPDHVRAWEDRGHLLHARLGLWELAARDLDRAFELQRPTAAVGWRYHALLRLHVGDVDGYRRVRAEMQDRFGRTYSPENAADLVRTAALQPDAGGMDEDVIRLAEALVTSHPTNGVYLYVLAAAKCRDGAYDEAIARCHQSMQATPEWPAKALNYPILVIAHHHLGQDAEARRSMADLAGVVNDWTRQMYESGLEGWMANMGATGYCPISVWDWVECKHYEQEARRLLGMESVDDPRLHMLRARGFAGLRQLDNADAEYDIALKMSPDDRQVRLESHRNRGYLFARKRDFGRAAVEFASAGALAPRDSDLPRFQAFAHSSAGDVEAYRRVCRDMAARFMDTRDSMAAYDVVDACVVRADSLDDMTALIPLARLGATWYVGGIRILGAAHCRAGQFDDAVRCYEEASKLTPLRARDWGFLAMAHQRLGHADKARRCLFEANRWIDEANRHELDDLTDSRPVWGGWYEPIEVPRLLQEAQALIDWDSAPRVPSQ